MTAAPDADRGELATRAGLDAAVATLRTELATVVAGRVRPAGRRTGGGMVRWDGER